MTEKMEDLLRRLAAGKAYHPRGADVTRARALAGRGFATLEDNGELRAAPGRRSDGERWACEITPSGRAYLTGTLGKA